MDIEDLEPEGGLALMGGTKEYPLQKLICSVSDTSCADLDLMLSPLLVPLSSSFV